MSFNATMVHVVFVEGNIGVGKSTLIDLLKQRGYAAIEEDISHWQLWDKKNLHPTRFTATFQVEVCLSMFKRLRRCLLDATTNRIVICERSLDSAMAFASMAVGTGAVDEDELSVIGDLCTVLKSSLPGNHTFSTVRLTCKPDVLLDRIQVRGRPGEETLTQDDLVALDSQFEMLEGFVIDCTKELPEQIFQKFADHVTQFMLPVTWM